MVETYPQVLIKTLAACGRRQREARAKSGVLFLFLQNKMWFSMYYMKIIPENKKSGLKRYLRTACCNKRINSRNNNFIRRNKNE